MEFYRTFIALPMEVGPEVHQLAMTLKRSFDGERISWVDPIRFHLTLRFLGDTPVEQVKIIGDKLLKDIKSPRIRVKLTSLGSFGPRTRPRVIWLGLESTEMIQRLYEQIQQVLKNCGFPPAEQTFRPHLTLGRVRSLKNLNNYHRIIESTHQLQMGEVEVDKLVFYRSIPGSGGPVYTPLYQVKFVD